MKEVFYLGNGIDTPESKKILQDTIPLIPEVTQNTHENNILLYKLFSDFHEYLNKLKDTFEFSLGEENLIGEMDELIENNKGLLWRATLG